MQTVRIDRGARKRYALDVKRADGWYRVLLFFAKSEENVQRYCQEDPDTRLFLEVLAAKGIKHRMYQEPTRLP
jgi:hypothetical protein